MKKDHKEEMADLFDKDLKKIKRAKYNDMDDTFTYKEKKHHSYILVIILFIIIIGVSYYYFIFDNPKTIFTYITNKYSSNITLDKAISYDLSINGKSEDNDINKIFDIINNMTFNGIIDIDRNNRLLSGQIEYNDKLLIDYNLLIDTNDKDNVYIKLDNISNKIIKVNTDNKKINKRDLDINDYEYVLSSVISSVSSSINNAKYSKKIIIDNNKAIKKMTLNINSSFINNTINKLLHDDRFINSFGNIYNLTNEEVFDILNKYIDDSKNINDTIDIYLSVLNNEFIKLVYNGTGNNITIIKDNDKYNYEVLIDYSKVLEGYFKINNTNNISINVNDISHKLSMDIDLNVKEKDTDSVKIIDSKKAISYEEIDKDDLKEIINNINSNEGLKKIIKDLSISKLNLLLK